MSKRKAPTENLNQDLCDLMDELADYEKNVRENMTKYKVYNRAAATLSSHPTKVTTVDEALKVNGIGEGLSRRVEEFLTNKKVKFMDKIRDNEKNKAILCLTKVHGITPANAKKFVQEGIKTLDDLKQNELKLNDHQKIGLKYVEELKERIPRTEMEQHEEFILKTISEFDDKYTVTLVGSYRTGAGMSEDIEVLITHEGYTTIFKTKETFLKEVVELLEKNDYIVDTMSHDQTRFMGVCKLKDGSRHRKLDIRLLPQDQYYCGVLHHTGSYFFIDKLKYKIWDKGFKIDEFSVRPILSRGLEGEPLEIKSEKDIFDKVRRQYVEPFDRL